MKKNKNWTEQSLNGVAVTIKRQYRLKMTRTTTYLLLIIGLTLSCTNLKKETEKKISENIETPSNKVVLSSEIVWEKLNPARGDKSPQAGTIWGDRKGNVATGFLDKFVDGFSPPPHIHNVTYRAVVIKGLVHNDDPKAENMWMAPGSFWTQPVGESHITSAKGDNRTNWIDSESKAEISFLWESKENNEMKGLFIKLPKRFNGEIESNGKILHSVVVKGEMKYKMPQSEEVKTLDAGSYFGSTNKAIHSVSNNSESEIIIYVRTNGNIKVKELK